TIVDKHGGKIEVESEINQGTVMRVFLPKRG
ncbi:MAG: sensor signal transduction histidine kinase, partial [Thermotoga sp.]|nr:sensor signal transduction histidine kinase [Thermotoga sp.]